MALPPHFGSRSPIRPLSLVLWIRFPQIIRERRRIRLAAKTIRTPICFAAFANPWTHNGIMVMTYFASLSLIRQVVQRIIACDACLARRRSSTQDEMVDRVAPPDVHHQQIHPGAVQRHTCTCFMR